MYTSAVIVDDEEELFGDPCCGGVLNGLSGDLGCACSKLALNSASVIGGKDGRSCCWIICGVLSGCGTSCVLDGRDGLGGGVIIGDTC